MAMEKTTKISNRYGLNLKLTEYGVDSDENAINIDFANEVSLEVTGEIVWATGGQNHSNKIGFKDPKKGTVKISTQLVSIELLNLISGGKLVGTKVSFKDDIEPLKYYKITGETVWQDESGKVYSEKITAYKCLPKPNYNVTYNGSGDPQSLDIEFELSPDSKGNFVDLEYADQAAAAASVLSNTKAKA